MTTPIEKAMNIGPVCGAELRSIGVESLDALLDEGWESVYERWVEAYPERIHTMAAYALCGAEMGVGCLALGDGTKKRARSVVRRLRAAR